MLVLWQVWIVEVYWLGSKEQRKFFMKSEAKPDVLSNPPNGFKAVLDDLRTFAALSDEVCLEILQKVPKDVLSSFSLILNSKDEIVRGKQERAASPGQGRAFSCPVCNKSFKRKWNRDRHMAVHKQDTPQSCPLNDCGKEVADMEEMKSHLNHDHGIESDQKKQKIGIRHDDHYDLLSNNGSLVHLEQDGGMTERKFSFDGAPPSTSDCTNCEPNTEVGAELQHDNHYDVLFGNSFSCAEVDSGHFHIDARPLVEDEDWDDFFAFLH